MKMWLLSFFLILGCLPGGIPAPKITSRKYEVRNEKSHGPGASKNNGLLPGYKPKDPDQSHQTDQLEKEDLGLKSAGKIGAGILAAAIGAAGLAVLFSDNEEESDSDSDVKDAIYVKEEVKNSDPKESTVEIDHKDEKKNPGIKKPKEEKKDIFEKDNIFGGIFDYDEDSEEKSEKEERISPHEEEKKEEKKNPGIKKPKKDIFDDNDHNILGEMFGDKEEKKEELCDNGDLEVTALDGEEPNKMGFLWSWKGDGNVKITILSKIFEDGNGKIHNLKEGEEYTIYWKKTGPDCKAIDESSISIKTYLSRYTVHENMVKKFFEKSSLIDRARLHMSTTDKEEGQFVEKVNGKKIEVTAELKHHFYLTNMDDAQRDKDFKAPLSLQKEKEQFIKIVEAYEEEKKKSFSKYLYDYKFKKGEKYGTCEMKSMHKKDGFYEISCKEGKPLKLLISAIDNIKNRVEALKGIDLVDSVDYPYETYFDRFKSNKNDVFSEVEIKNIAIVAAFKSSEQNLGEDHPQRFLKLLKFKAQVEGLKYWEDGVYIPKVE